MSHPLYLRVYISSQIDVYHINILIKRHKANTSFLIHVLSDIDINRKPFSPPILGTASQFIPQLFLKCHKPNKANFHN